jgi:hypothetical protein
MKRMRQRDLDQLEATSEHRRREDASPRLRDEIEHLLSLRITFEDLRPEGRVLATSYTKPVLVATAPSCFEIRCMEARCSGWHDLTDRMLRALREKRTQFAGQSDCNGMIGDAACDHTLRYTCEAIYQEKETDEAHS